MAQSSRWSLLRAWPRPPLHPTAQSLLPSSFRPSVLSVGRSVGLAARERYRSEASRLAAAARIGAPYTRCKFMYARSHAARRRRAAARRQQAKESEPGSHSPRCARSKGVARKCGGAFVVALGCRGRRRAPPRPRSNGRASRRSSACSSPSASASSDMCGGQWGRWIGRWRPWQECATEALRAPGPGAKARASVAFPRGLLRPLRVLVTQCSAAAAAAVWALALGFRGQGVEGTFWEQTWRLLWREEEAEERSGGDPTLCPRGRAGQAGTQAERMRE
ncbi:hypothetical protein Mp_3g06820 [Marchantia polymorpha subsp. ruderalis]|uniref:Uncharacterized protein n=2 Tax=Marchantia polymorpha TaxID=3197 RepID=A0AAF6AY50_MARPO|nr:hypothetical protein MARPO_0006s0150 [Marchantia polymorpha]BBN04684.1 hypothetical protein Mp_3g06820 [Marchantia polymorpha subsp. ruderalis]|eukprot:PTQ48122.1 hypothetical protein MARPO_0006s0150 [Marchantia polymorpha]